MTPGDGPTLELIQYINPPPSDRPTEERNVLGASHVAFTCEDIQGTFDLLMSAGRQGAEPSAGGRPRPVAVLPPRTPRATG